MVLTCDGGDGQAHPPMFYKHWLLGYNREATTRPIVPGDEVYCSRSCAKILTHIPPDLFARAGASRTGVQSHLVAWLLGKPRVRQEMHDQNQPRRRRQRHPGMVDRLQQGSLPMAVLATGAAAQFPAVPSDRAS